MKHLQHVLDLTRRHNSFLQDRIDLVASNSWVSSWARLTMSSLLSNSYCIGLPGSRLYGGCDYIDMIEREIVHLATELFGTRYGVVQFLSGMQANIGAYNAILKPGDTIVTALAKHGGHYSHNAAGPLRFFGPRIVPVPFDDRTYNIDVERLDALLAAEHPILLVVGWSEFLFPHPLQEIRTICDRHGTRLMYDMSHVAGLLAGGAFQPQAGALADIVTSSTGKSLHAPDHGLCLFNDEQLRPGVLDAVMPLLTSNTHPHELAALGIALAEMKAFGADYAAQVVRNTKALGRALAEQGIDVLYCNLDYSESHTLLIAYERSDFAVAMLDRAGLSVNATPLPWDEGDTAGGLRIGTQVVTRRGLREADMEPVAEAIARVLLHGDDPIVVQHSLVTPLARAFQRVEFSFDTSFPFNHTWQDTPYRDTTSWTAAVPAPATDDNDAVALALRVPAFHALSVHEIATLTSDLSVQTLAAEALLLRRGDSADSVYFVLNGCLQVLGPDDHSVIAEVGEGRHVGEMGVMLKRPRANTVTVSSGGPATLLRMQAEAFCSLLRRHQSVANHFNRHLQRIAAGDS